MTNYVETGGRGPGARDRWGPVHLAYTGLGVPRGVSLDGGEECELHRPLVIRCRTKDARACGGVGLLFRKLR